jgi:hypothetical protein
MTLFLIELMIVLKLLFSPENSLLTTEHPIPVIT